MGEATPAAVGVLLLSAAADLRPAPPQAEPWTLGWSVEEYRRSGRATLTGPHGAVQMGARGLRDFEAAVAALSAEPAVAQRWDTQELWAACAELVAAAAASEDHLRFVIDELHRLRTAGPSLVVLPVANVSWRSGPRRVAGGVIGRLGEELVQEVSQLAAGRPDLAGPNGDDWVEHHLSAAGDTGLVAAAMWHSGVQQRAFEAAVMWLEDVCCLAVLLDTDPDAHNMWSLRGSRHRPGVRGLTADTATVEALISRHAAGELDLACEPFLADAQHGAYLSTHWYSTDPVPLDDILDDTGALIDRLAVASDEPTRRIRVAARRYADAHWAEQPQPAAVSLAAAADALTGPVGSVSDRRRARRLARLHPDPTQRRPLRRRFRSLLTAGRAAAVDDPAAAAVCTEQFAVAAAADIRWAVHQLISSDPTLAALAGETPQDMPASLSTGD